MMTIRDFAYGFAKLLLLPFPKAWNNKDTQGAVLAVTVLAGLLVLLLSLGGCYSARAYTEFEHHSSVPDLRDLNTTDQLGGCFEWDLGRQRYTPAMTLCLHKEVGGAPVFGKDPVGTVRIQQPIWIRD